MGSVWACEQRPFFCAAVPSTMPGALSFRVDVKQTCKTLAGKAEITSTPEAPSRCSAADKLFLSSGPPRPAGAASLCGFVSLPPHLSVLLQRFCRFSSWSGTGPRRDGRDGAVQLPGRGGDCEGEGFARGIAPTRMYTGLPGVVPRGEPLRSVPENSDTCGSAAEISWCKRKPRVQREAQPI